jgi:polyhydroxybutyrate depolymerase
MKKIIILLSLTFLFACGGGRTNSPAPQHVAPELSVTASAENNTARLSWSVEFSPDEKANFRIYLGDELIHDEDGISQYDIDALQPNRDYAGRVVATGLSSKASATTYFSFKTLGGPLVPISAKINPVNQGTIDVSWWSASASGEDDVVYDVALNNNALSKNSEHRFVKISSLAAGKEHALTVDAADLRGNKIGSRISFIIMTTGDVLSNYEINVSGAVRQYSMFIPENAEKKKLPLVIWLHGSGMSVWPHMADDYWVRLASRENFYLLQPQAINDSFNSTNYWAAGISKGRDDTNFIRDMLDLVASQYDIDTDKIYMSGFSSGGDMVYYSLQTLEDKIAAIAPVAGVAWKQVLYPEDPIGPWASYKLKGPMPLCSIWGTADNAYAYNGSDFHVGWHDIFGFWIKLNNVDSVAQRSINLLDINTSDESIVIKYEYRGASISSDIDHYMVVNGSHTIPGITRIYGHLPGPLNTGPTNQDTNAYEVIWEFFKKHKLSDRM